MAPSLVNSRAPRHAAPVLGFVYNTGVRYCLRGCKKDGIHGRLRQHESRRTSRARGGGAKGDCLTPYSPKHGPSLGFVTAILTIGK